MSFHQADDVRAIISHFTKKRGIALCNAPLFVVPSPVNFALRSRRTEEVSAKRIVQMRLRIFSTSPMGHQSLTNPNTSVRVCFFVPQMPLECRNSQCLQAKSHRFLPCSCK